MAHCKILYIKEDVTLQNMLLRYNPEKLELKLEEEFIDKYCNCCGEYIPTVQDICECAGLIGNTFSASNGLKCKWDKRLPKENFMIVNLADLNDSYLDKLENRVYGFAISKKRKNFYISEYDCKKEYKDYIEKIKNRLIVGIAVLFDCKY